MKKLLMVLVLLSAALCYYVTRPETIKAPAGGLAAMTESFSYPNLARQLPRPLRLLYQAWNIREITRSRIDRDDWVPFDQMPPYLSQALVAVEDRRFYSHHGIDPDGILRAILVNLQADEVVEGGSTLTQQLVKNNLLSSERSMQRKAWEAVLSLLVEARCSKEEILEMYLNTTFFGNHSTGVKAAARNYFGIQPKQLSLSECAVIAGLPNAPTALNPYVDKEACRMRRDLVLEKMHKEGFITSNQLNHARHADIVLAP
jgi:membrane peptidoglycan carboxypeptidase